MTSMEITSVDEGHFLMDAIAIVDFEMSTRPSKVRSPLNRIQIDLDCYIYTAGCVLHLHFDNVLR